MTAGGFTLCGSAPFDTTIDVVLVRSAATGLMFKRAMLDLRRGLGPADWTLEDRECEPTRACPDDCLGELVLDLRAISVFPGIASGALISAPPFETKRVWRRGEGLLTETLRGRNSSLSGETGLGGLEAICAL